MKPPLLYKSPGIGRQVISSKLVNISSCWVLQGTQRIAPTTQASITKKCSFQGGRRKVLGSRADGFILWWWLQLPWLNCFPYCLSASVPAIIRGSKLSGSEGCTVRYSGCTLERLPFFLPSFLLPGARALGVALQRAAQVCCDSSEPGKPCSSAAVTFSAPVARSTERAPWVITAGLLRWPLRPPPAKGKVLLNEAQLSWVFKLHWKQARLYLTMDTDLGHLKFSPYFLVGINCYSDKENGSSEHCTRCFSMSLSKFLIFCFFNLHQIHWDIIQKD